MSNEEFLREWKTALRSKRVNDEFDRALGVKTTANTVQETVESGLTSEALEVRNNGLVR